jgi:AhpC/TSA family
MKLVLSTGLVMFLAIGGNLPVAAQQPATPSPPPQAAPPPPPPAVKVGDAMPDFSLAYLEPPAEAGGRPQTKQVKLSDYKGKQAVVLAFFPAAFSPG